MQCFMRSLKVVYMVPAIEVHLAFQQVTGHPIGDDLCLQSAVESFRAYLQNRLFDRACDLCQTVARTARLVE